jgi:hypothetical protein
MVPALFLMYFVVLCAMLLIVANNFGMWAIAITFGFIFWIGRELASLSRLVDRKETSGSTRSIS